MLPFKSKADPYSEQFQALYATNKALCDELQQRLLECKDEGRKDIIARHKKLGKLTGRERVELLLDQDSPFLELLPFAGWGQEGMTPGGSMVTGIGIVCGMECMIQASLPTMKGGALNEAGVLKLRRIEQICLENNLPYISLLESGGADLTQQFKVFHIGGAHFRELTVRSKEGIPSVCVVLGTCTAGGAYMPGMSDYSIMVKNQSKIFLGGPPLVKMATGEVTDDESLGGADMHSKISGVSDYLAQDERHAIQIAREVVNSLNYKKKGELPLRNLVGSLVEEPIYPIDELLGIISDVKVQFDSREVIARFVDGSRFSEFKKNFGPTLVTGWASVYGIPIGVVANNGVLFSDAANKGSHFIQICNKRNIPIIFMHNITGFMVGKHYEQEGIVKHGAKMINAVSNSGVPHISIIMSASYGAGNYGMCGRAYNPRFLFSWPTAKVAVMGAQQLAGVMDIVQRQSAMRAGRAVDEAQSEMMKAAAVQRLEEDSDAYYCSSRCLDDGVIDPRDTRAVIGMCLSVAYSSPVKGTESFGICRM